MLLNSRLAFMRHEITRALKDGSEKLETFNHGGDDIYRIQIEHFFDCMENNKAPAVSLEDGSDVLRIVVAARESSAKGKTVALA